MTKGSCHCGKVTFEISGPFSRVYKCYCETCRKLSGSAFSVVTKIQKTNFKINSDLDNLHIYESKPGKERHYCRTCCSPIYVTVKEQPNLVRNRLGLLDGDPDFEIVGHIWVSEKPKWQEMTDSLPQFEEWNA